MLRILVSTCLTLAWAALCAAPAGAFLPEDEDVLAGIEKNYGRLESFQAIATFPDFPDTSVRFDHDGVNWRQEWIGRDLEGREVIRAAAIGNGPWLDVAYPEAYRFPMPMLTYWNVSDPGVAFLRLDVDQSLKSYAFLNSRPCLVLGQGSEGNSPGSLWLDLETYAPLRLTFNGPSGEVRMDFTDYESRGGILVPQSGSLVLPFSDPIAFSISWRGVNSTRSDDAFRADLFLDTFGHATPGGEAPEPFPMLMQGFPRAVR